MSVAILLLISFYFGVNGLYIRYTIGPMLEASTTLSLLVLHPEKVNDAELKKTAAELEHVVIRKLVKMVIYNCVGLVFALMAIHRILN